MSDFQNAQFQSDFRDIDGLWSIKSIESVIDLCEKFLSKIQDTQSEDLAGYWVFKLHDFYGRPMACFESDPSRYSVTNESRLRDLISQILRESKNILIRVEPKSATTLWLVSRFVLYEKRRNHHDGEEYTEEEEEAAYKGIFEAAKLGSENAQREFAMWKASRLDDPSIDFNLIIKWLEPWALQRNNTDLCSYALDSLVRIYRKLVSMQPTPELNQFLQKYMKMYDDLYNEVYPSKS